MKILRRISVSYLMLAPTVIVLLMLGIFPLAYALYLSTMKYNLLAPLESVVPIGAGNYVWALTNDDFWTTIQTSIIFTVVAVVSEFFLGLVLALLATKLTRGATIVRTLLATPLLVTPVVVSLMFKLMMEPYFGVFNYLLGFFGIPPVYWLSDASIALLSIILADIWSWTPFIFLVLFAAIESIPRVQFESSSIDGATGWHQFRYIALPWITPAILVVVLIRAVDALKETDKIFNMTYGGPGFTTATLPFYIWYHGMKEWQMGESTAMAFVLVIIINVFTVLTYRVLRRR